MQPFVKPSLELGRIFHGVSMRLIDVDKTEHLSADDPRCVDGHAKCEHFALHYTRFDKHEDQSTVERYRERLFLLLLPTAFFFSSRLYRPA